MTTTNLLTPKANELAELLGVDRALRLVEKFGGNTIYVPRDIPEEHHLHELLGAVAARKLSSIYGRDALKLPRCAAWMRQQRDVEMRGLHTADGLSAAKLARRYRMTERQVWRILAEGPANDRQGKLF